MFGGFSGNGQNNSNTPNVTTKIRSLYSDTACMQLSYWNENLSIRINPMIGINEQGIRQYDYNRRGSTALTSEKCTALAAKIKEIILPEIEKVKKTNKLEKPINVGLVVGQRGSSFFIEYKPDDSGKPSVYATLFTNVGQDNKAPKDGVYTYKFIKTTVIDNYDPESGTGTESVEEAEFMFFYEKLKNLAMLQATIAHAQALESITRRGQKMAMNGNAPQQQMNNGGYQQQGAPRPPAFSQPPQNNYAAPVSTFNADELPF